MSHLADIWTLFGIDAIPRGDISVDMHGSITTSSMEYVNELFFCDVYRAYLQTFL